MFCRRKTAQIKSNYTCNTSLERLIYALKGRHDESKVCLVAGNQIHCKESHQKFEQTHLRFGKMTPLLEKLRLEIK